MFLIIIKKYEVELKMMGINPSELDTHICRKYVSKMLSAGCIVSPPIISLCISWGWCIGRVKERDIKCEAAWYQNYGRCDYSLDQKSKLFACSPYFFGFYYLETLQAEHVKRWLDIWLEDRLNQFSRFEADSMHLRRQWFSSVGFHHGYLKTNMSCECPLVPSAFYRYIHKWFCIL